MAHSFLFMPAAKAAVSEFNSIIDGYEERIQSHKQAGSIPTFYKAVSIYQVKGLLYLLYWSNCHRAYWHCLCRSKSQTASQGGYERKLS